MLFSQTYFNLEYFKSELKSKDYLSAKKKIYKDISSKSFGFLHDIYSDNLDEIINLSDHLKNFENVLTTLRNQFGEDLFTHSVSGKMSQMSIFRRTISILNF